MFPEKPRMTNATPRLAPELMPSTSGPAIGFRKSVCICNPLNDKAMPTVKAVTAFGILKSKIIVFRGLSVSWNKTLKTSEVLILTEPKKISRSRNNTTKNRRQMKTILIRFPLDRKASATILFSAPKVSFVN
jgi:hypothetical protein